MNTKLNFVTIILTIIIFLSCNNNNSDYKTTKINSIDIPLGKAFNSINKSILSNDNCSKINDFKLETYSSVSSKDTANTNHIKDELTIFNNIDNIGKIITTTKNNFLQIFNFLDINQYKYLLYSISHKGFPNNSLLDQQDIEVLNLLQSLNLNDYKLYIALKHKEVLQKQYAQNIEFLKWNNTCGDSIISEITISKYIITIIELNFTNQTAKYNIQNILNNNNITAFAQILQTDKLFQRNFTHIKIHTLSFGFTKEDIESFYKNLLKQNTLINLLFNKQNQHQHYYSPNFWFNFMQTSNPYIQAEIKSFINKTSEKLNNLYEYAQKLNIMRSNMNYILNNTNQFKKTIFLNDLPINIYATRKLDHIKNIKNLIKNVLNCYTPIIKTYNTNTTNINECEKKYNVLLENINTQNNMIGSVLENMATWKLYLKE